MLFNEVYGNYYSAVARILKLAVRGELTRQDIYEIAGSKAFAESVLSIPGPLNSGEWPLLTEELKEDPTGNLTEKLTTPLKHEPETPLTTLQKRWLKALLEDPRIRLFDVPAEGAEGPAGGAEGSGGGSLKRLAEGLEDVQPLYKPGTVVYFDQYSDGDPYEDKEYTEIFHTVLRGLREKRKLRISFTSASGNSHCWECVPLKLEYSLKDDKFRLIISGDGRDNTINIARISECELLDPFDAEEAAETGREKKQLVMELTDERNALERAMLHFSHLEKETVKLDKGRYRITLRYNLEDETEILIRVLSFGPVVRVLGPDSFIERIRERLKMQKRFG